MCHQLLIDHFRMGGLDGEWVLVGWVVKDKVEEGSQL